MALTCLGTTLVNAGTVTVNPGEIEEALRGAEPGDVLQIEPGKYRDVKLILDGTQAKNGRGGKRDKPLRLEAGEPGKVIFTGSSHLRIAGEWIEVSGLTFANGNLPEDTPIISFRHGDQVAKHSRLTESVIFNYNPEDRQLDYDWIEIHGRFNRVDHNAIYERTHKGVTLVVVPDPEGPADFTRIDHNYFGQRTEGVGNGWETIRVGTSHVSLRDSHAKINNNLFEECDGEIEIISNKTARNEYKGNAFVASKGQLCLRHGEDCIAENNVFLGKEKEGTSGIRVVGPYHTVRQNRMHGLRGTGFRAPLGIVNGVPNSPLNRYRQAEYVTMEKNTVTDATQGLAVGLASKDGDTVLPPRESDIINNTFVGIHDKTLLKVTPSKDFNYVQNHYQADESLQNHPGFKAMKDEADPESLIRKNEQMIQAVIKNLRQTTGPAWWRDQNTNYVFED